MEEPILVCKRCRGIADELLGLTGRFSKTVFNRLEADLDAIGIGRCVVGSYEG